MSPKPKKENSVSFEKSLEHLEKIVEDLESGEKGLEESLSLFEDGVRLSKDLTARLEEVKHRVDVLTKQGKDKFKEEPLDEEDES